ncbi:hypothetical protein HPB48_012822 [Haemaphysalis longicornis]|uniref:Uncharacterized protein n=1 Tax=Haemaphysalis longicornis TaxID=44386 RepID=A0A9J6GW61_HAELO|nr:hypothetical protein HPB48_012822 [Haemaphysalis longicornis]
MAETLASILESMGKLEAGQDAILTELKGLKERQDATDSELKRLAERLGTLENKVASQCTTTSSTPSDTLSSLNDRLTTITARCDDAEETGLGGVTYCFMVLRMTPRRTGLALSRK